MFFLDARHGAEASGECERNSILKELDKWGTRHRLHTYVRTTASNTYAPPTFTWSTWHDTRIFSGQSWTSLLLPISHTMSLFYWNLALAPGQSRGFSAWVNQWKASSSRKNPYQMGYGSQWTNTFVFLTLRGTVMKNDPDCVLKGSCIFYCYNKLLILSELKQ